MLGLPDKWNGKCLSLTKKTEALSATFVNRDFLELTGE